MSLMVPHAEARNRLFVLAPLADLAPGLVPPGWTEPVATVAARRRTVEGEDAARPIATWDGADWLPLPAGTGAVRHPDRGRGRCSAALSRRGCRR